MPGMDGLALLAEIRARRPEIPTLMITGHGESYEPPVGASLKEIADAAAADADQKAIRHVLQTTKGNKSAAARLLGGRTGPSPGSGLPLNVAEGYDIDAAFWAPAAPMPVPAMDTAAVAVGGKIFVIGGAGGPDPAGPLLNTVQIYKVASNTWTLGAPMPTARAKSTGAGTRHLAPSERHRVNSSAARSNHSRNTRFAFS